MENHILSLFISTVFIKVSESVECRETSLDADTRAFDCPDGCCGPIYQRYCCSTQSTISLEAIIGGITAAAVLLVALIVGGFVYLCKKKTPRRRLVYPDQRCNSIAYPNEKEFRVTNTTMITSVGGGEYINDDPHSTYSAPVRPGYGMYPQGYS